MRSRRLILVFPLALATALAGGPAVAEADLSQAELAEVEQLLFDLNFDPGVIDGVVDARTRTAIRLYQEFAALSPDGEPTPALLAELRQVASAFAEMKAAQPAEPQTTVAEPEAPPAPEPEAAPKREPAPPAEPEPTVADAAPEAEPAPAAEPEPAAAEVAPEPAPAAAPEPASEPEPESQAAVAKAEPEPEPDPERAVAAAVPGPEAAPKPEPEPAATAQEETPPAEAIAPAPPKAPGSAPKPGSGFDLDGVIARLVRNSRAKGPAAPTSPAPQKTATADGASRPAAEPSVPQVARTTAARDGYDDFRRAAQAVARGDMDRAVELYTRAIESGDLTLDHLAVAFYNRANVHYYKRDFDSAIGDYDQAILNRPNFPAAYYNRGFAHEAEGARTQAVADFTTARDLGYQKLGVRAPDLPPPRP